MLNYDIETPPRASKSYVSEEPSERKDNKSNKFFGSSKIWTISESFRRGTKHSVTNPTQVKSTKRKFFIDWLVLGFILSVLGVSIALGVYELTVFPSDDSLKVAGAACLIAAPIGPALYLTIYPRPILVMIGAALYYLWALLSSNCWYMPSCIAFVHLILLPLSSLRWQISLTLVSIGALGAQSATCVSENIGVSLVFIFWSIVRYVIQARDRSLLKSTNNNDEYDEENPRPKWLVLSAEEVNTEQIRDEIRAAKEYVEERRPGLLSRIENTRISFDSLKLNKRIGYGSFGEVYRAVLDDTHIVAVKRLPREQVSESKVSSMLTEIDIVSTCSHPNVVRMFGWCDDPYVVVCLEYANGGSLKDYLQSESSQLVRGWCLTKSRMAMDAAAGLAYLHGKGILHRDVKADNMLVFCGGENSLIVKIADFGSSRPLDENPMTAVGSPYWLAPEVARGAKDYDGKADVWSFGVVLCEIASHQQPYEDLRTGESFFNLIGVSQGRISPLEQLLHALDLLNGSSATNFGNVIRLVERCCKYEPRKRPTINMIMFELLQMMVLDEDEAAQSGGSQSQSNQQLLYPQGSFANSWKTEHSSSVRRIHSMRLTITESDDELGPLQSPGQSKRELRRISDPTSARKSVLLQPTTQLLTLQ